MNGRARNLVTLLALIASLFAIPGAARAADVERGDLVRRNVKELSAEDRKAFVDAVHALKAARSPFDERLSYYDQFVAWHVTLYKCSGQAQDIRIGHGGPFFLPWHRAFVVLFERALREVTHKRIAVPYWDWTDPDSTAVVFADDFMGGDGDPAQNYAVTTGPFRKGNWTLNVKPRGAVWEPSYQPYLVRKRASPTTQPPLQDLMWALGAPEYDTGPYDMTSDPMRSFRNALEGWWREDPARGRTADPVDHTHCGPDGWTFPSRDGGRLHNQVHSWVGGVVSQPTGTAGPTMFGTMILPTSPNDPVFFLHHANIDRLWAKWQDLRGNRTFQPVSESETRMEPFAGAGRVFTPASVMFPTDLGYTYSDYTDSDDVAVTLRVASAWTMDRTGDTETVGTRRALVCVKPSELRG